MPDDPQPQITFKKRESASPDEALTFTKRVEPKTFAQKAWNYLTESGEALGEGAKALPKEAGSDAADVWKALTSPAQEGAAAGGRVVGKLGDVGMFASGGGAGPLAPSTPPTGLARGLDVKPRVAQVPRPQLALPPPTIGMPGRAPIQTGNGLIPAGP